MSEANCPRCDSPLERLNRGVEPQFECKTILAANGNIRYRSPKCADLERAMWENRVASLTSQLAAETKRADEADGRVAILEGELANAAEQLMRVHPIAEVMHIGLRRVAVASKEVVDLFVGMRECLEENAVDMDKLTAAESARDDAVREVERLTAERKILVRHLSEKLEEIDTYKAIVSKGAPMPDLIGREAAMAAIEKRIVSVGLAEEAEFVVPKHAGNCTTFNQRP